MKGQLIELTDGTRMEVKVNFGTLYYLQKIGGTRLAKSMDKKQKKQQKLSDDEQMTFAAKVIYAILRSNGKQVTFDEALMLMPSDTESIKKIVDVYSEELERVKKKEATKAQMKTFTQK